LGGEGRERGEEGRWGEEGMVFLMATDVRREKVVGKKDGEVAKLDQGQGENKKGWE